MAKKLKQGERYPEGFTQGQILLKLCEKDKTPTSEIIDFLRDNLNIREQKNIRDHHLKNLEKNKLVKRESAGRGHPDYWYVDSDPDTLVKLLNRFVGTDDQDTFLYSQYCLRKLPDPRDPAPVHGKEITVPLFSINLCDLAKHPNPPGLKVASPPIAMSGVHKTIEGIIVEHAVRLHSILRRFYPELQLYTVLDAFLTELHPVAAERDHIPFDRPDP